ncbi:cationic amino acid transporter, putative [Haladaptatus paucihalophilus DX253]|uniref:Cationic amino acid transporter, putative n=1 Tax=Haladaptatus paucihalophilus DX253 TaxID=797209 RepID=E7QSK7_HALPU|nr:universal stress protein [Haladaptatus paucihalophilus]EFW92416.1 cationic amino acid transporter, putative [Haladaptatus paucihalophilus DX253]SHK05523.1 Universal stress protein family protein [Haladaptatus paucihalophilus DX253]
MNTSPMPLAPSLLYATAGGRSSRQNVVVLSDGGDAERTVSFAATLADARGGELILVNAAVRSSGTPLNLAGDVLNERQAAARRTLRTTVDSAFDVRTRAAARVGRNYLTIARTASEEFSAGVVVVDESESMTSTAFGRSVSTRVGGHVDCDVISVGGNHLSTDVTSILVPVAGGPHSGLAVDMARYLAEKHGAWLELLHVVPSSADERAHTDAEQYIAAANERLGDFSAVDEWILEADDATDAIVDQSQYYDVTVLGAPQKNRLREFVFGSTTADVRSSAYSTVVSVERPDGRDSLLGPWL